MSAHLLDVHKHSMPKSIIFVHLNITGRYCLYVASTAFPGTIFGFLHLFYCIACGSWGVHDSWFIAAGIACMQHVQLI